jgi:hypothetical protein
MQKDKILSFKLSDIRKTVRKAPVPANKPFKDKSKYDRKNKSKHEQ